MSDSVSVSGRIRLTLEVEWPASFGEKATGRDIYTTAARECENILRNALTKDNVRYRIIGEVEPLMVILPAKKPT